MTKTATTSQTNLRVSDDANTGAVLLHLLEVLLDLLAPQVILPLLGVLRERLLLGAVPLTTQHTEPLMFRKLTRQ